MHPTDLVGLDRGSKSKTRWHPLQLGLKTEHSNTIGTGTSGARPSWLDGHRRPRPRVCWWPLFLAAVGYHAAALFFVVA